jgi:hypothetical protein
MADSQWDDERQEHQQEELDRSETNHLAELSSYPAIDEELPPLPPWYRRWISRVWQLFPCTIVCVIIAGVSGSVFQFGGDFLTGLERGLLFGLFIGCVLDARLSLNDKMIDE